jgi:hypothetical protein
MFGEGGREFGKVWLGLAKAWRGPRGPAKETARPVEPMPFEIMMEPPRLPRQPRERRRDGIDAG